MSSICSLRPLLTTNRQALITCNCLGSVAFQARPGAIKNIGTLYVDKVHKASPLEPLESNIGHRCFATV